MYCLEVLDERHDGAIAVRAPPPVFVEVLAAPEEAAAPLPAAPGLDVLANYSVTCTMEWNLIYFVAGREPVRAFLLPSFWDVKKLWTFLMLVQ